MGSRRKGALKQALSAISPTPMDDGARRAMPVAPRAKSHYSPQQKLEWAMAQAIAMRRR